MSALSEYFNQGKSAISNYFQPPETGAFSVGAMGTQAPLTSSQIAPPAQVSAQYSPETEQKGISPEQIPLVGPAVSIAKDIYQQGKDIIQKGPVEYAKGEIGKAKTSLDAQYKETLRYGELFKKSKNKTITPEEKTELAQLQKKGIESATNIVLGTMGGSGAIGEKALSPTAKTGLKVGKEITPKVGEGISKDLQPLAQEARTFQFEVQRGLDQYKGSQPKAYVEAIARQNLGIPKEVPKGSEDLFLEAQKYKSAEEFVKAQDVIGRQRYKEAATKMSVASNSGDNVAFKEAQKEMIDANKLFRGANTKSQLTDLWNKAKGISVPSIAERGVSKEAIQKRIEKPTQGITQKPGQILPQETLKVGEKPPSPPSIPPTEDAVNKVMNALKEAEPIRGKQETLYSQERSKRLARAMSVGEKIPGEKGFHAQLGQLKGELPKVQFESIRNKLSQPDIDSLFQKIEDHPGVSGFEKITAKEGLAKLFGEMGGKVPTEGELGLLSRVFPPEFIDTLSAKRPLWDKIKGGIEQVANIPRSIMASFDLSFGGRQGAFAAPTFRKEFYNSWTKQFKIFGSEKAYQAAKDALIHHPDFQLANEAKVSFTDIGSIISQREEKFASSWAEQIPIIGRGIRASGRAYTAFANKFRLDIFSSLIKDAEEQGLNPRKNMDLAMEIGNFVNNATGRGKLPGGIANAANALNAVFFSPRLMFSRLHLLNPVEYVTASPFVRKTALKSALNFAGTVMTILTVAKLSGAEVGLDPRSADFAKIKIGNTRIDIAAGFQQYIRMAAQLITGQYKSTTSGLIQTLGEGYGKPTRLDILARQVESKEAPIGSFITDLLRGKDFAGNPISIPSEIGQRLYPMVIGDAVDLARENPKLLPASALGVFGVGLQTYQPLTLTREQQKVKPIYDQVKQLVSEGKTEEAKSLVSDLSDEEYKTYKSLHNAIETNRINQLVPEVQKVRDQVKKLVSQGKEEDAKSIVNNLSEDEYKAYKKIAQNENQVTSQTSSQGIVGSVVTYAKAIGTDPLTAFNRIFTGQRIVRVTGGAIIVQRMSLAQSQKEKKLLGGGTEMTLDHIIPLELGGSNSESNLKLVPKDEASKADEVENYLGKQLKSGRMKKDEAQRLIRGFKNGTIKREDIIK